MLRHPPAVQFADRLVKEQGDKPGAWVEEMVAKGREPRVSVEALMLRGKKDEAEDLV